MKNLPSCVAIMTFFFSFLMDEAVYSVNKSGPRLVDVRLGIHPHSVVRIVLDFEKRPEVSCANVKISSDTLQIQVREKIDENISWPKNFPIKSTQVDHKNKAIKFMFSYPAKLKKCFLMEPSGNISAYRYVIDLEKDKQPQFHPSSEVDQKNMSSSPSESFPPVVAPLPPPSSKKIIVIDAGHGGVDGGAIGCSKKVREKNITLSMAKLLAEKLSETGRYKTILTRNKDTFMRLRQRLKKARDAKGDLFISLHADSNPSSDMRGLSIYTLSSVASDREAARLAKKENEADLIMGPDNQTDDPEVAHILVDLVKRETMNLSTHLARSVAKQAGRYVLLLRKPHRFADFYVLRSPQMPSVLVELGHISNEDDEKFLTSQEGQDQISTALVQGIDSYFKEQYA